MDATQAQTVPSPARRTAKHTILFLAANPIGTSELALGKEAREIQAELERCGQRDRFEFVTRWAVQPLDLLRELRKLKPTVVHFSGHGGELGTHPPIRVCSRDVNCSGPADDERICGLFFQGPDGEPRLVSAAALQSAFSAAGSSVRLVVLNACYSELQAKALLAHVDCVVGMDGPIRDDAARTFAMVLYGGLGECESVGAAFKQGVAAIELLVHSDLAASMQPDSNVRLLTRSGVDPDTIYIVPRPDERRRCTIVIKATLSEFDTRVVARVRDELRSLSGDVSLEITEIREGSVRLTVALSSEAAECLEDLRDNGRLNRISGFDVSSVRVHEATDGELVPQSTGVDVVRNVGADLRGVDFHGARLDHADLVQANLRRANLSGASVSGANLRGADLSGANLHGANFIGANLLAAKLICANLRETNLIGANLHTTDLGGANLSGANLSGADLSGANLLAAKLIGANLRETNLIGADLHTTNLSGANLSGANLSGANLRRADLSGANLRGANLSETTRDERTRWPDGFDTRAIETNTSTDVAAGTVGSVDVAESESGPVHRKVGNGSKGRVHRKRRIAK